MLWRVPEARCQSLQQSQGPSQSQSQNQRQNQSQNEAALAAEVTQLFFNMSFLWRGHRVLGRVAKATPSRIFPQPLRPFGPRLLHSTPSVHTIDMSLYPPEKIRNFSIIAHIDHGKSTLADRLLENAGIIKPGANKQFLDKLKVERERGITVKAQAQTVANFYLVFGNDLHIIPVLNKIDLPFAVPDQVMDQMTSLFDFDKKDIMKISAKTGSGVEDLLPAVIRDIPCPTGSRDKKLKGFLFDLWYDDYRGVVCLVEVVDGVLKAGEHLRFHHTGKTYTVLETGIMHPDQEPTTALLTLIIGSYAGQVGYVITGMKDTREARVGDTIYGSHNPTQPMAGFKESKPVVYAGFYPMDASELNDMSLALDKLMLTDASVTISKTRSNALGLGWRLGFLGLLHMDVFNQRLEEIVKLGPGPQEYGANVIVTSPTVPYRAKLNEKSGGAMINIESPDQFPDPNQVECYYEPTILGTLIFPAQYMGKMLQLCQSRRGVQKDMSFFGDQRVMLRYVLPLAEIATNFYDAMNFDYEEQGYDVTEINKMEIIINKQPVDALAMIVHSSKAEQVGRAICTRLRDNMKRQMFAVAIQASFANRIVARENLKALRKDVLAKC
eukprot:Ihof_evm15s51 gene=Ihof_evmTU15s51